MAIHRYLYQFLWIKLLKNIFLRSINIYYMPENANVQICIHKTNFETQILFLATGFLLLLLGDYPTLSARELLLMPARWCCIKQYKRKQYKLSHSFLSLQPQDVVVEKCVMFLLQVEGGKISYYQLNMSHHIQHNTITTPLSVKKKKNSYDDNDYNYHILIIIYLSVTQENIHLHKMRQWYYKHISLYSYMPIRYIRL